MAGIRCFLPSQSIQLASVDCVRFHGVKCCSNSRQRKSSRTPKLFKFSVSGVTELIRLLSPAVQDRTDKVNRRMDEVKVSGIDDILTIIKSDYEKAYFVTGVFTSAIYADDCTFEDPTIKFQGRDLYSRNLKLLVPFFDSPSIFLKKIEKSFRNSEGIEVSFWGIKNVRRMDQIQITLFCADVKMIDSRKLKRNGEFMSVLFNMTLVQVSNHNGLNPRTGNIVASWRLRTYLKLPWRPLILIDGSTLYDINEQLKVIRHVESWEISALEALGQLFTPEFISSTKWKS